MDPRTLLQQRVLQHLAALRRQAMAEAEAIARTPPALRMRVDDSGEFVPEEVAVQRPLSLDPQQVGIGTVAGAGLSVGMGQAVESLGGLAEALGAEGVGRRLRETGRRQVEETLQELPPETVERMFTPLTEGGIFDPYAVTTTVTTQIPNTAAVLLGGFAGAAGGAAVAGAPGAVVGFQLGAGAVGGALGAGESAAEIADRIDAWFAELSEDELRSIPAIAADLRRGVPLEEAKRRLRDQLVRMGAVLGGGAEAVSDVLLTRLGATLVNRLGGRFSRRLRSVLLRTAAVEGTTEAAQQATTETLVGLSGAPASAANVLEAAAQGAVAAAGTIGIPAGAARVYRRLAQQVVQAPPAAPPPTQPQTQPTQPQAQPTQPQLTQPQTQPTQPQTQPTQPQTQPTQPQVQPTLPFAPAPSDVQQAAAQATAEAVGSPPGTMPGTAPVDPATLRNTPAAGQPTLHDVAFEQAVTLHRGSLQRLEQELPAGLVQDITQALDRGEDHPALPPRAADLVPHWFASLLDDIATKPADAQTKAAAVLAYTSRVLDGARSDPHLRREVAAVTMDAPDPEAALRRFLSTVVPWMPPEVLLRLTIVAPRLSETDRRLIVRRLGRRLPDGTTIRDRILQLERERIDLVRRLAQEPEDRSAELVDQLYGIIDEINSLLARFLPKRVRKRILSPQTLASLGLDDRGRIALFRSGFGPEQTSTAPVEEETPAPPAQEQPQTAAPEEETVAAPVQEQPPAAAPEEEALAAPPVQEQPQTAAPEEETVAAPQEATTQPETEPEKPVRRRKKRARPKAAQSEETTAQPEAEPEEPVRRRKKRARPRTAVRVARAEAERDPAPVAGTDEPVVGQLTVPSGPVVDVARIGPTRTKEKVAPQLGTTEEKRRRLLELLADADEPLPIGTLRERVRQSYRGWKNSAFYRLLERQPEGTTVQWVDLPEGVLARYRPQEKRIELNRRLREAKFDIEFVLAHELAHGATWAALHNPADATAERVVKVLRDLHRELKRVLGDVPQLRTLDEFVAALFTEPRFVELLDQLPVRMDRRIADLYPRTVWGTVKYLVTRLAGFARGSDAKVFVERVLDQIGQTTRVDLTAVGNAVTDAGGDPEPLLTLGHYMAALSRPLPPALAQRAQTLSAAGDSVVARNKAIRGLLRVMSVSQMDEQWGRRITWFDREAQEDEYPLHRYRQLALRRDRTITETLAEFDRVLGRWQSYVDEAPDSGERLHRLMLQATLWEIEPSAPFQQGPNAHLKATDRSRYDELRREWEALDDAGRDLYREVRDLMDRAWSQLRQIVLAARLRMLGIAAQPPRTLAELQQLIRQYPDKAELLHDLEPLFNRRGPYFPLKRFGEYYVFADTPKRKAVMTTNELAQLKLDPFVVVHSETDLGNGRHHVVYQVRLVENYESHAEARVRADQLRQSGQFAHIVTRVATEGLRPFMAVPKSGMMTALDAELRQAFARQGITGQQADRLQQMVIEALFTVFAELTPETSVRRSLIRRVGVPGAHKDMLRSVAAYGRAYAFALAHMRFDRQIVVELDKIFAGANQAYRRGDEETGNLARAVGDVLVARELELARYGHRQGLGRLTVIEKLRDNMPAVAFVHILSSPAWWFTNATQPITVTLPVLAAEHGTTAAMRELTHAYRQLLVGPIGKVFLNELRQLGRGRRPWTRSHSLVDFIRQQLAGDPEAAQLIDFLAAHNQLDISLAYDVSQLATEGVGGGPVRRTWRLVYDWLMAAPHITETLNRTVTALAAYRLARQKGMKPPEAQRYAMNVVANTQIDYSNGNKPLLFLNPNLRPFLLFKQYAVAMYYLHVKYLMQLAKGPQERREALRALAGMAVMHAFFAGALGAVFEPAWWLIALVGSLLGEDPEELARELAVETFGRDLGLTLLYGVPYGLAEIDTTRINLSQLLLAQAQDITLDDPDRTLTSFALMFLGVPVSLARQMLRGLSIAAEGDVLRGVAEMSPRILRDLFRAYDVSQHGLRDRFGNVMVPAREYDPFDVLVQALGLPPTESAEYFKMRRTVLRRTKEIMDLRERLLRHFNQARRRGDWAAAFDRLDAMIRFNLAYPEFAVTADTLRQSIRASDEAARRRIEVGGTSVVAGKVGRRIAPLFRTSD